MLTAPTGTSLDSESEDPNTTNRTTYTDLDDARLSVFKYIETFYNPVRLHQTLGYLSPNQYEAEYARLKRRNSSPARIRRSWAIALLIGQVAGIMLAHRYGSVVLDVITQGAES